jgi:hypothetical protein
LHDTTSVEAGMTILHAVAQDATRQAISPGFITNSKLPHWIYRCLRYYINKNYYFNDFLKRRDHTAIKINVHFVRKIAKSTVNSD